MDGKGSRLEVKVERAETNGGEEQECRERGDSHSRLRRRWRGEDHSWNLNWGLSGGWRRLRGGWCVCNGECRGNAKARAGAFDPFSRVITCRGGHKRGVGILYACFVVFLHHLVHHPQHAQSVRIRPAPLRPRQHPDVHCGPVGVRWEGARGGAMSA